MIFHGTVKPSPCPKCMGLAIGATAADTGTRAPRPGDLTVCVECGQICRFTESMDIEAVSDADLLDLPRATSQQLRSMRRAVRQHLERFN